MPADCARLDSGKEGTIPAMTADIKTQGLEARVAVLEGEVEGEKIVTRYILRPAAMAMILRRSNRALIGSKRASTAWSRSSMRWETHSRASGGTCPRSSVRR